ncbi:hypothetical protein [Aquimarina agarilytica]|uniref:hypothetical protein n=1 Tax=Aquimarina agarilytica TaxID=1087449 RepID=UPI000289F313|nr:hypothetical protein [Aquimarina agarilytica]
MKKIIATLVFISVSFMAKSQNVKSTSSVEKSLFGIQVGVLSIYALHEAKLSHSTTLRTELGLEPGVVNDNDKLFFTPVINIEPRWYYNLDKRQKKSKRIDNNSGNFCSLKTKYHPDWFTISDQKNINFSNSLSLIPTWGIRRNLGKHFNYETAIGAGYIHYFDKNNTDDNGLIINLHLRIGYSF